MMAVPREFSTTRWGEFKLAKTPGFF